MSTKPQFTAEQINTARRNLDRLCNTIGPAAADLRARLEAGEGNNPKVIQSLLNGQVPSLHGLVNPGAGEGKVW
jgi:hypothetical protein